MSSERLYFIMSTLDEPVRLAGMTIEEGAGVAILLGVGFLSGAVFLGLAGAIAYFFGIKYLKKGQGAGWLLALLYWHLPGVLTKLMLKRLPFSHYRQWLT